MSQDIFVDEQKKHFLARLQKQLVVILLVFFGVLMVVNLGVLTVVGTKGQELSGIRSEQESQKIKNDLLRSRYEALKVSSTIEKKAKDDLKMNQKDIRIIDVATAKVSAEK